MIRISTIRLLSESVNVSVREDQPKTLATDITLLGHPPKNCLSIVYIIDIIYTMLAISSDIQRSHLRLLLNIEGEYKRF